MATRKKYPDAADLTSIGKPARATVERKLTAVGDGLFTFAMLADIVDAHVMRKKESVRGALTFYGQLMQQHCPYQVSIAVDPAMDDYARLQTVLSEHGLVGLVGVAVRTSEEHRRMIYASDPTTATFLRLAFG